MPFYIRFGLFLAIGCATLAGCKRGTADGATTTDGADSAAMADGSGGMDEKDKKQAVCLLQNTPVWSADDVKARKWVTQLNLGETVEYLDQNDVDEGNNVKRTYFHVRLKDGKDGWVRADLVANDGYGAAITDTALVYARPDLMAKTAKKYAPFDVVAVMEWSEKDGFVQVRGKRAEGQWIETLWIRKREGLLSSEERDVALASLYSRAQAQKSAEKRRQELQAILANEDLRGAKLHERLARDLQPAKPMDDGPAMPAAVDTASSDE